MRDSVDRNARTQREDGRFRLAPPRRVFVSDVASVAAILGVAAALAAPLAARMAARTSALDRVDRLAALADGARISVRVPEGALLRLDQVEPQLASWSAVGGCGVGGPMPGYLMDFGWGGVVDGSLHPIGCYRPHDRFASAELVGTRYSRLDLQSTSAVLTGMVQVPGRMHLGLSVPYLVNDRRDCDYDTNGVTHRVEGFGDLGVSATRHFGLDGATAMTLVLGLPTAQYEAKDTESDPGNVLLIPADAQLGRGVVTLGLAAERAFDVDWGAVILGTRYDYGGGENDAEYLGEGGSKTSDSLTAFCLAAYRTELFVHFAGVDLTYSFERDRSWGEPVDGSDGLLVTLGYRLEYSHHRFPVFLTLSTSFGRGADRRTSAVSFGTATSF